jgi:hypothetical protein
MAPVRQDVRLANDPLRRPLEDGGDLIVIDDSRQRVVDLLTERAAGRSDNGFGDFLDLTEQAGAQSVTAPG